MMFDIQLTPGGRLALISDSARTSKQGRIFAPFESAWESDWREGLFSLATQNGATAHSSTMRFWGRLTAEYLTRLCHIPTDSQPDPALPPPEPQILQQWTESAPPMAGGEYLSSQVIIRIWTDLGQWIKTTTQADGGLEQFLRKRASRWNQVGRVTFHLAENKADPQRPFAFMASFSTSMGAEGQVKHLPMRQALELYAGTKNKQALLKLLLPVQEAAKRCPWVQRLVENGDIYRPMAWDVPHAYEFLRSAQLLEESGLAVRLPDWWKKRPRPKVQAVIGSTRNGLGVEAMLDFQVQAALGDTPLTREELQSLLSAQEGLVLFKGQWVEVDSERLQQALEHWESLEQQFVDDELSFIQGMRLLAGTTQDLQEGAEKEELRQWAQVTAGPALRELLARLRNPGALPLPDTPLVGCLRPYQREGAAWLQFLTSLGLGACLADDMGLGKTLQVLALLQHLKATGQGPALLVLPASLMGNWRAEVDRFAPELRLFFIHPSETPRQELEALATKPEGLRKSCDVAVTTYAMLARQEWLAEQNWPLVILDEAQAIKNHTTAQSKAAKKLTAQARVALTGTPVENRLGDLWSLFDFLNPGLLGAASKFKRFVKDLEARTNDPYAPLRRLVAPYILRRLKTDKSIITDLPDKTESLRYCFLTKPQAKLYQKVVNNLEQALKTTEDTMARRGLVLQTLLRLKQICNHPGQFTGDGDYAPKKGGKFIQLADLCEELASRQERVLVFTQFREIIAPLADYLETLFGRPGLVLHGGTPVGRRQDMVQEFQREDGPPFFVLSLKAGGTGLNLTAASHVIHFDRWWNPAVENQATDRAFRIGQSRNVLVHKFVTRGTIEERIDELINDKRELAEGLLSGAGEVKLTELPDAELMRLVRLDLTTALPD